MGFTTGTKQRGNTTANQTAGNNEKMTKCHVYTVVIWVLCGYMSSMLFYGLCGLFVVIIHNLIYIYI